MMITTKAEFLRLASAGYLGNQMQSWPNVAAARADHYHGPVMIRDRVASSLYMRPDIPMDDVNQVIERLVMQGANRDTLYLTHMTHTVGRRINGELWRSPAGLYLNYSTVQANVRASLDAGGKHVTNAAALAILRHVCNPDDFDDLMWLLDAYDDHAIEFTAYDRCMGTIPNRQCVVWEVRMY